MPRLTDVQVEAFLSELPGWSVVDGRRIQKEFRVPDFAMALQLVNHIGAIAEAEDHHPDLTLSWGRVGVLLWTHVVDGLTENDLIVAAQCDRAYAGMADGMPAADRGA